MMNVPYVDIGAQTRLLKKDLLRAIEEVLDHGNFILGQEVQSFEEAFAAYCGVRFAVGVNSGTDALFLSLKALGIGRGDEVITAPNSFIATVSVIIAAGAKPVFVDVRNDYNINPDLIKQAITPRTRAIMPVHLTGKPADMDPILEIAHKHKIQVIEDAAQAVGAKYREKKTGAIGDIGCFSLHPLKTLNACGDGGIITTDDENIFAELRRLRNFGLINRDETAIWGYNSRLDSLQAAILLVKLKWLDEWNEKRRQNARFYESRLKNVVSLPVEQPHECGVFHTYVVQAEKRSELQDYLQSKGIGTRVHYPIPLHLQPAARELGYQKGDFPVCEEQSKRILSLPVHQGINEEHVHYVADNIVSFYQGKYMDKDYQVLPDRSVSNLTKKAEEKLAEMKESAKQVRRHIIRMAHRSKGPHVGSCLSCADILTVLYFDVLKLEPWPDRDIFILSKGHAAMALYGTLAARGIVDEDILDGYYQNGGTLPAHLDKFSVKGVEVSAGSLGHGFNVGLGIAFGLKKKNRPQKVYALIGDGETQEGSVWEGAMFAPKYQLDNFTAIIDRNNLQGYGRATEICHYEPIQSKWESFGWHVIEINGHDCAALGSAFREDSQGRPKMIIARTTKGKGISFMEDKLIWHYYVVTDAHRDTALGELK